VALLLVVGWVVFFWALFFLCLACGVRGLFFINMLDFG